MTRKALSCVGIGLQRPHRSLFEGIAFGTRAVMRQTRERLNALSLRTFKAEVLWDLDTPEDYVRAKSERLLSGLD